MYPDVAEDEEELGFKIAQLLAAGTTRIWVVRLQGERRVEAHAPGEPVHIAAPGEALAVPGVLANEIPAEALWDRAVADEAMLRNLLHRTGHRELAELKRSRM